MRHVTDVWDFPFRLGPDGSIAVAVQDSDRDLENLIVVAVLTRPGERTQAPTFGIADPAFVGWERPALQRHLLDFGPTVDVTDVAIILRGDQGGDREEVTIAWERSK